MFDVTWLGTPVVGRWPLPPGHSPPVYQSPDALHTCWTQLQPVSSAALAEEPKHQPFSCWRQLYKYHCSLTRFPTLEEDDGDGDGDGNNNPEDGGGEDEGST